MPTYAVGTIYDVKDPAGFEDYRRRAGPTLQQYGGKLVMMSQSIEVADGSWAPIAIIMFEFENLERAKEWHNSPEYQAALPKRLETTDSGLIFADLP